MRTTVEIPDALFKQAKRRAAEEGVTLREIVTRALRAHLGRRRGKGFVFRWRTEKGGMLIPEELLNSRAALYDYLDDRDGRFDRG